VKHHIISTTESVSSTSLNDDDSIAYIQERQASKLTWDQALTEGNKIWELYEEYAAKGSSPGFTNGAGTPEAKRRVRNNYSNVKSEQQPPPSIQVSLAAAGITTDAKWIHSDLTQKGAPNSHYVDSYLYDDNKGVIVAENIRSYKGATLPWSEATYVRYLVEYEKDCSFPAPIHNLKYVFQVDISNEDTTGFIEKVIDGSEGTPVQFDAYKKYGAETWHVFKPETESFKGLLGSDNGRGTGRLVNDHYVDLGKRGISEIYVCRPPECRGYTMKLTIGDP
jgi:hypothetical protein